MLQTKRDVQILKTREKEVEILKAKREKKNSDATIWKRKRLRPFK